MKETQVPSLDGEDPLEEGMATYSSVLAWEIPWTQKPERLHLNTHTQWHQVLWKQYTLKVTARARHFTGFEIPVQSLKDLALILYTPKNHCLTLTSKES